MFSRKAVPTWREKPTMEQACQQDSWLCGGPTLEQPVPLHPVGQTHTGAGEECEEFSVEEKGAEETMCDELMATPIPCPPVPLGGRERNREWSRHQKRGAMRGGWVKIWVYFLLLYSELIVDKFSFPKWSLFGPWESLLSDLSLPLVNDLSLPFTRPKKTWAFSYIFSSLPSWGGQW